MRGRVRVLFLPILLSVFLSLSPNAAADCSYVPRYSGQFRTTALDLSVDGTFVWVATGYGVQLLQNDTVVDSIALPGTTRAVRADGGGIAYAGSGARVYALRRAGKSIEIAGSAETSGNVNDILIAGYLFVATANGIDHFSLGDPAHPVKTAATFQTSTPNVTSLAATHTLLYAADGDASVEIFAIGVPALPQRIGMLDVMPFATSVHVAADGKVFVSDRFGQTTDVFIETTRIARLSLGATSFAPAAAQAYFVAGPDRTLRAVDVSDTARVAKLFEYQLAATDGTDNAIHAMERSGDKLYLAAGDNGVVIVDAAAIARPWPLVSYAGGATNSVRISAAGDKAWFGNAAGQISEQTIDAAGLSLREVRSWAAGAGSVVRDGSDTTLLTTNGAVATVWALVAATPAAAVTLTFPDAIAAAVQRDTVTIALLANGSVWTASGNQAPQKVNVPAMTLLARAGNAIAMTEVREDDGKTVLHYYANGDFTAQPRRVTIDGAASGSLALDAAHAAIFTFAGVNVIDLAGGGVRVIPESDGIIPKELLFSGGDLLLLGTRRLRVYDDARTLLRDQALPADPVALDATPAIAVMATGEGTAATSYLKPIPTVALPFSNSYYDKLVAGADRIYLLDDDGVDVFSTLTGDAPAFVTRIAAPGTVDIAATDSGVFTVSGSGLVTAYSRSGDRLAQVTLSEGPDSRPLALLTAGNAVWLALSTGCGSGTCQQKTLVLDPATLGVTSTLTGGAYELSVTGTRAYVLTSLPNEIRVVNLADPLHPAQVISTVRPQTAVSIAASGGAVRVLGDKLYSFSEATLTPAGDVFSAAPTDKSQRIRIAGDCLAVTGRSEAPELYVLPSFAAGPHFDVPSPVRALALQPGRLLFLTTQSLEIWSTASPTPPAKHRSAR